MHPAFDLLVAESATAGKPIHYKDDLFVHDKAILDELPLSVGFLWALRDTGTHTIAAVDDSALFHAQAIYDFGKRHLWFWWDGKTLRKCRDFTEASDLLAKAVAKLPKWRMTYRGGEVTCRAVDLETATLRLNRKFQETIGVWLYGTQSGVHAA